MIQIESLAAARLLFFLLKTYKNCVKLFSLHIYNANIQTEEESIMSFCGNCGTQIPEGAKVCPKCGQPVGGVITPETTAQTEASEQAQSSVQTETPVQPEVQPVPVQQPNPAPQAGQSPQPQPYQYQNRGPQPNQYQSPNPGPQPYYQQQGPSQASQTLNQMGEKMTDLVPKTKSEGLEVACFIMAAFSMKLSLSMFGQVFNIIGLILGVIPVILLLVNKEKTANKTVQMLALIMAIAGIAMSMLGIILVAADVPAQIVSNYIANKVSDAFSDWY